MINKVVYLKKIAKTIIKRKQKSEMNNTDDGGSSYDDSMEAFNEDMKTIENNIEELLNEIEKTKGVENYAEKVRCDDLVDIDELMAKEEIENEIVEEEVKMESIEDELEANEKEIRDLENQLADLHDNKIRMERELNEKTVKLYSFEQESRLGDIQRLDNEVNKLIVCIESLEKRNDELDQQKKSLESELYETQCIFEQLQEKFLIIESEGKKLIFNGSFDDMRSTSPKSKLGATFRRKSYAATSHVFTFKEITDLKYSKSDEKKLALKEAKESETAKQELENQAKELAIETSQKNTLLLKIQNEKKLIEKEIENQSKNLIVKKSEHKSLADIFDPKINYLKSDINETKLLIENIRVEMKKLENKRQDKEVNKRRLERNKAKINKKIQRLESRLNEAKIEVKQKHFTLSSLREFEKLKLMSSDSELKKSLDKSTDMEDD